MREETRKTSHTRRLETEAATPTTKVVIIVGKGLIQNDTALIRQIEIRPTWFEMPEVQEAADPEMGQVLSVLRVQERPVQDVRYQDTGNQVLQAIGDLIHF